MGRFAPTPSGPLHAGSLVAAIASYLDAKAHHGQWRLRIDNVDGPRVQDGAEEDIVRELRRLGMQPDGPLLRQQGREERYTQAFDVLVGKSLVFA